MEVTASVADQAKLWSYIYGFSESLVLKCAVQLNIANIIHTDGDAMTLSQLSSKLPSINPNSLYRLMRQLTHMKLFTRTNTGYSIAPAGTFLVTGWDKCMTGTILGITDKEFVEPWHYIKDALAGNDAFKSALGMNIWDYMGRYPEKNQLFNEAMACDTRLAMSALVNECKAMFEGVRSLVDVGGGTGTAVMNIAKAFPSIQCSVYDLPHVIADSNAFPEINRVAGDMFEYIPNADAILMKCILHDWTDEKCVQILKKCKEAVPKNGGKVIIVDIVLDVESQHPYTKMRLTLDLDMMLNTGGGKERTEEEWKKLIYAAGFTSYNITEISAAQSVIEAFPY